MEKLRIGLLLESFTAPAWIYWAIERLIRSESAELALVVVKAGAPARRAGGPFVFRAYDVFDKKIFLRGADALAWKSLTELLAGAPVLTVPPSCALGGAEGETLRAARLDILVNCGFGPLEPQALACAVYGVWSYQFGAGSPSGEVFAGYAEVAGGQALTAAALRAQRAGDSAPRVLYQSHLSTYRLSAARNRNAILWFASSFLARQARALRRLGPAEFFQEATQALQPADPQAAALSNWQALRNIARVVQRGAREYLNRSRTQDTWNLWFAFHENPVLNGQNFKLIPSPAGCFWADPWVIRHQGNYFVFVEEYPYARAKGHLSVVELDSQGNLRGSAPILVKEYHLSYPCVFQHDGTYWMIPESSSNQTIDLYECIKFPTEWRHKMTLFEGVRAVDTTVLFHAGKWWLFTAMRENSGAYPDVELNLFYADTLFTTAWTPHPLNPIVSDVARARPAGRIFLQDGRLIRPSQDCAQSYGHHINLNEIIRLSETDYQEVTRLTLQPNWAPGLQGTHTFAYDTHLTLVDAFARQPKPGKHTR